MTMKITYIAKLFKNGSSQAVRLPAECRFLGNEVYVTRDDATGDVILSKRPGIIACKDFFDVIPSIEDPEDFMSPRPMNVFPQEI